MASVARQMDWQPVRAGMYGITVRAGPHFNASGFTEASTQSVGVVEVPARGSIMEWARLHCQSSKLRGPPSPFGP